ncbi:MAG: LysM peptidoglycan-binding domain-containing protein [Candidatus Rokubacteria bacterium]|nr:LysM peptidoglycan-binding domain-containing protein [Candidatus Rokubacteria bacterium]
MRGGRGALLGLALALGAARCAGAEISDSRADRPDAPVSRPAPRASVSAVSVLAATHRQKAEGLERQGFLRRALDEWKIALTIDPADAEARTRQAALEARVETAVADRLRQGREALGRGAHLEARRHFLTVLALDPGHRAAVEALRSEVREVRFVAYTVRRGDTLDGIAERYYGDRSRGEVIAETNQLRAGSRLVAGMALRVPEIPGVPFLAPEARPRPAEPPEVNPLLAEARDALDRGDYLVALADVERLLGGSPQHPEGLDLKKAILYGLGKAQLEQQKYAESYQTLDQLARLAPGYQDAPALLRQVRDRLVQQHYSEGLRLYREEKIEEAIAEWRATLELDPQHANARRSLEQAERLLRALEQRRRPPVNPGG